MSVNFSKLNLLVIRSTDIERSVIFYQTLGLKFCKHKHGKGLEHYASESDDFVFEIYPQSDTQLTSNGTRIGFSVNNIDKLIERLTELDTTIISNPKNSEWGRRAVIKDLDGHTIELTQTNCNQPNEN